MYTNKQHQSNKLYQSINQSNDRSIRKLFNKHICSMKLSEGLMQIHFGVPTQQIRSLRIEDTQYKICTKRLINDKITHFYLVCTQPFQQRKHLISNYLLINTTDAINHVIWYSHGFTKIDTKQEKKIQKKPLIKCAFLYPSKSNIIFSKGSRF